MVINIIIIIIIIILKSKWTNIYILNNLIIYK